MMPSSLRGTPSGPGSTTGMPETRRRSFRTSQLAKRHVGRDRHRVDHHPAFEALHLADLLGLLFDATGCGG